MIAEADRLLDELFPLAAGSHADATAYRVVDGALAVDTAAGLRPALADPAQFAGLRRTARSCCAATGCTSS